MKTQNLAIICITIIFSLLLVGMIVEEAKAASVETIVQVVIMEEASSASMTASVPCNEVNCPTKVEEDTSLWGKFVYWLFN